MMKQRWHTAATPTTNSATASPHRKQQRASPAPTDYVGRRIWKKITTGDQITLHERYLYRDYQQIAALDLLAEGRTLKHAILWDPTQPIATRPLAFQQNSDWYTYGWDLTKNITELFTNTGTIATTYTYTPYGEVRAEGEIDQPIQWSSEVHDAELGLIYYNYRYYNPTDGRWTRRDFIGMVGGLNWYIYLSNYPVNRIDRLGLRTATLPPPPSEPIFTYPYGYDDGHRNALQGVAFPTQDENGCQCQAYGCDVGETTGKTTYLATLYLLIKDITALANSSECPCPPKRVCIFSGPVNQ